MNFLAVRRNYFKAVIIHIDSDFASLSHIATVNERVYQSLIDSL